MSGTSTGTSGWYVFNIPELLLAQICVFYLHCELLYGYPNGIYGVDLRSCIQNVYCYGISIDVIEGFSVFPFQ